MTAHPLRFFTVLTLVSALLFALDSTRAFSVASSFIGQNVMRPVASGATATLNRSVRFVNPLLAFRRALTALEEAEQERDFYRGEYFRLRAVEDENEFLRQALSVENGRQRLLLADITVFDAFRPNQEVVINKGAEHGVRPGQAVIARGRTLAGVVRSVEPSSSRVLLVTSEEARIPVLLSSSQTNAVTTGSATGVLQLNLVPREAPLTEGELVLTSGIAQDIPPNLLVGEVRRIIDDEAASFKRATVEPFIDIGALRQVFVVTGL